MFFHLDNFSVYDVVRTTGNMDLTWLSKAYQIFPAGNATGLRVQQWTSGRTGMGTVAATAGVRSIYLPLGKYLQNNTRINITQRLLDYVPNGVAICGLSLVGPTQDNHILSFGFTDTKNGFVRYVDAGGIVRNDTFTLPVSLTGNMDVVEWGFVKDSNRREDYRPFTIWVNNKAAYLSESFCQVGASSSLAARITGGNNMLGDGATSATGFINNSGNVTIPRCGVTDLVVNDGARNGLVRVLSRQPTVDVGPNTMIPSVSTPSNAALVGVTPPDATKYLTAVSAAAGEMYGAPAFTDLGSESVLAFAIHAVGQKNNPFALDLEGQLRLSGQTKVMGGLDIDLTPSFAQVILEKNPITGLSWTALEANSANFGVKVT